MKQSMKTSREADLSFSKNPQLNIMEAVVRKASLPFRKAFSDIEQKVVTKEGAENLALDINSKLLTFFKKEIISKLPDVKIALYGEDEVPASGSVWVIHGCGSVVNLAHGYEDVCVYFALLENGVAQSALVFYPLENKIYTAEKSKGSFGLLGRLRVSGRENVENALISIFSPVNRTENDETFFSIFKAARENRCHSRISGNIVHDAITLGQGKIDALIAMNIHPMDAVVANLIIREAGGYTCELNGSTLELGSTSILAANHKLQGKFLKMVANA